MLRISNLFSFGRSRVARVNGVYMTHKLQKTPLILAIFLLLCLLPISNKIKAAEEQRNNLPEENPKLHKQKEPNMPEKVDKTDEEWMQLLTPEQYRVTREKGTEPPFNNEYYNFKGEGTYQCVSCGADLFDSKTKFESGTGWPSFWDTVSEQNIKTVTDKSLWYDKD